MVTLHKVGEVSFDLIGANGFKEKAETDRFMAAGSLVRTSHSTSSLSRLQINALNLIGANGFKEKAETDRFMAAGSLVRTSHSTSSLSRLKINALKCVLHVRHDHISSFNQSYY